MEKLSVLLTTEGTYPYYSGGVSTWCHVLTSNLAEVDYSLISVVDSPLVMKKFNLPKNIKNFITIPLWGTTEPSEHLNWVSFSHIFLSKLKTSRSVIEREFIPIFSEIIEEVISVEKNPVAFGNNLLKMYKYFTIYDYYRSLKSRAVYRLYKEKILRGLNNSKYFFSKENIVPTINELEESLGWIFRFFNITNTHVPKTDITHSSAAGFCGIPNVISKLLYGAPYLLTEHGVYIREQYLSGYRRGMSDFLKGFFISLAESVVKLNYEHADIICPVCCYNSRWEKRFGVNEDRIKVIYNGVDPNRFIVRRKIEDGQRIIAVARIDPLKDIENFIWAARYILNDMPQISFSVYGSVSDEEYYKKCLRLRDTLELQKKFSFCGHAKKPEMAYHSGDIVVLSSISEAFPYSIVEAMMCGKPIVATDVGGVSEALDSCGIVVPPRDPEELAKACIRLMQDKELRYNLSMRAQSKARESFTIEKFTGAYLDIYNKLKNMHRG